MKIERFDAKADTDSLRACHQIALACQPYDAPFLPPESFNAFKGEWAQGWGLDEPSEAWLARDDLGEPIGCYLLRLPEQDNREVGFSNPMVRPDRRRSGMATALLAHCAERVRQAGRYRLRSFAPDGSAGEAFARAKGAVGGIDEIMRTMDVDASLPARLGALRADAEPHAEGYEMLSWQAPTAEEHLSQIAELERVEEDAPRDEGMEPMAFDEDRIRSIESAMLALSVRYYTVVARHSASGQLVALTRIAVDPETPDWGFQQLTSVRREHRGHRLGLLVKIAMLELLAEREPALRHIFTGNAGANEHMIAINEHLGYHVAAVLRSWELNLAG
jgi:RimJ/RimL family protein N-acetyltransferase/GNAT superfamily N-acetyltransferase